MKDTSKNVKRTTVWLCTTAVFMGMNIALSSFGVPVPGGHLYMNDIVICTAAILFDPLAAFLVGGVGAFLGDMLFYPVAMFVSLATHGLYAEKAPGGSIRTRCDRRRHNNGSRLFSRTRVRLCKTRNGSLKAPVSDITGGSRCDSRNAYLPQARSVQAL